MNAIKYWLALVRPVNLFILGLTMYGIDIFILQPNFDRYGILFSLDEFHFFLLVFSTLLICAAGYIINDYYDVQTDAVNKPEKLLIGKYIEPSKAFSVYLVLTGIGLLIGIYLSIELHYLKLVTVQVISIVLLYFYSASYKKIALLGNVIVALLTALSIITVGVYEPHIYQLQREADYYAAHLCWNYILGIALFAFLLTMIREIVKDLEDSQGDEQFGARTIPVAWGIKSAKGIAAAFIVFTIFMMVYLTWKMLDFNEGKYYVALFAVIAVFLFHSLYSILAADEKRDYSRISTIVKIIMLLGICIMPIYYFSEF